MAYFRLGLFALTLIIAACTGASPPEVLSASKSTSTNRYALLIGVNQYDHPKIADLTGPVNDADFLAEVLQRQGWRTQNITLLTDDSTAPTRANIIAELEALVAKARQDDFIVLSFAGHGSRQPARKNEDNPEGDGLDEFFLPKDTGDWNTTHKTTKNIILDNDIWQYLKKLRSKGAFVWLIFDTCHAGTMTRVAEMARINWQVRYVDPQLLGIPVAAHRGVNQALRPDSEGIENGGHVAFYATQSWQLAPELRLPSGSATAQMHGLFTYTLAQEILSASGNTTYRQLAQQIRQNYLAQNIYDPAPWAEGEAGFLARPLFGREAPVTGELRSKHFEQWPLQRDNGVLTIPAGRLHGLANGTVLALMTKPTDDTEQAAGYLEIREAGVFGSRLRSIEHAGKTALAAEKIPPHAYARLFALRVPFTLRVALPACQGTQPGCQSLTGFRKSYQTDAVKLDWATDTDPGADIHLHLQDGAVWLLPQDGTLVTAGKNRTPSLSVETPDLHGKLAAALQRIAKVHNLVQLAREMTGAQMTQVVVHAEIVKADKSVVPLEPGTLSDLKHGTHLRFRVENRGRQAVDVTLLFIDSQYGVAADYPHPLYENTNRIEARGKTRTIEMVLDAGETTGVEQVMVIAVRARDDMPEPVNFRFLAQPRLEKRNFGANRQGELYDLFADAAFGIETGDKRGRTIIAPILAETLMEVFSWRLVE